jgi:hypothetical protein
MEGEKTNNEDEKSRDIYALALLPVLPGFLLNPRPSFALTVLCTCPPLCSMMSSVLCPECRGEFATKDLLEEHLPSHNVFSYIPSAPQPQDLQHQAIDGGYELPTASWSAPQDTSAPVEVPIQPACYADSDVRLRKFWFYFDSTILISEVHQVSNSREECLISSRIQSSASLAFTYT